MHNLQLQKYFYDLDPAPSTIATIIFTEKTVNIYQGQNSYLIYLSKT